MTASLPVPMGLNILHLPFSSAHHPMNTNFKSMPPWPGLASAVLWFVLAPLTAVPWAYASFLLLKGFSGSAFPAEEHVPGELK